MACGETISESIIVGAIDFGTTFSGYAFAIRNDYKVDPMRVSGNHWQTGSQPGLSLKTPSCILFDPTQKFHSFGGDAEDKYAELAQEDEHIDWFYFKRFKMQLYDKHEIPRDFMLEGENGLLMPALKVFSESIKYLRGHLENHLLSKQGIGGFQASEVDWVLTVPAIWTDPAKQFMREAANLGGIPNSRLILALEPEAASIYCKNIPVDRTLSSGGKSTLDAFAAGTQYLILDAGGGTVDITVQEIKEDGDIKQIYMANGGDWGGVKVDQAFDQFLLDIVGMETMDKFRNEDKADYLSLCREFEVKKRGIRPDSTVKITLRIPLALTEKFQEVKGVSMKNSVKSNKSMSWVGDKLRLDPDTARDFYQESCKQIVQHLGGIFRQTPVAKTDIIIMVGGFSESQMLQEHVKSTFPHKTVIIPEDAGLAVLKGAVQFGFNPKVINPRISRFTYGVSTNKRFRPRTDPEEKKQIVDHIMYCRDRFGKHVERGQPVEVDQITYQRVYTPLTDDQQKIILPIYSSRSIDPEYIDETDSLYLGNLVVDLSDIAGGRDREVLVGIIFGGTDIEVQAEIKSTNEKVNAHFNFLR